jgi:hypothetical protein
MNKKLYTRIFLAYLLISALNHWSDIKRGAIDGFNASFASEQSAK